MEIENASSKNILFAFSCSKIPVSFSVLSCMIVRFVFSAVTYVSDETAKGLFVHITAALGVYLIMTKIAIDILSHLKNEKISVQKRADPSF